MAVRVPLCIVVALQISLVFCKSDFYHQYFSRHHRGSTTTSVATPILSSADSSGTTRIFDEGLMPQRSDYWDRDRDYRMRSSIDRATGSWILIIGLTVFAISVVSLGIGLVILCCRNGCCRGIQQQQRRGFIMFQNPQQQTVQQDFLRGTQPSQHIQSFPPTYSAGTVQQQHYSQQQQHSPARQDLQCSTTNANPSVNRENPSPTSAHVTGEKY